jgi:glycosyltransferase involved in cell wall biosynthesis
VAVAHWLQRVMKNEYGDPDVPVVPDAVDWAHFDSSPRAKRAQPRVGFLYGGQRWKGAHVACEAMRLLQARIPALEVVAFGSRRPRPELALPARFEFHLRPPQGRIPSLYRSTDCWIVPSLTEGFGLPGLEAAASHCPLVVTRCGGPEDYVEDGRGGYLVPIEDPRAMAERVEVILAAPAERWREMSAASYEVARRFHWDRSAERLENVMLDLLGRGGRRP